MSRVALSRRSGSLAGRTSRRTRLEGVRLGAGHRLAGNIVVDEHQAAVDGGAARWLRQSGSTLWQLLPLSEVSPGQDSPYAASSSCALEPVHIDIDSVEDLDGELTDDERRRLEADRSAARVDFEAIRS